jgi:hypothetical protein
MCLVANTVDVDFVLVRKGGRFEPRPAGSSLVGARGMRSLVEYLAQGVVVERPKWVSALLGPAGRVGLVKARSCHMKE